MRITIIRARYPRVKYSLRLLIALRKVFSISVLKFGKYLVKKNAANIEDNHWNTDFGAVQENFTAKNYWGGLSFKSAELRKRRRQEITKITEWFLQKISRIMI